MCLGIPGEILSIDDDGELTRTGTVSFGGIRKQVNLVFTPEAGPGDFVIVHVGCAISTIDETAARKVFDYLREASELEELDGSAL